MHLEEKKYNCGFGWHTFEDGQYVGVSFCALLNIFVYVRYVLLLCKLQYYAFDSHVVEFIWAFVTLWLNFDVKSTSIQFWDGSLVMLLLWGGTYVGGSVNFISL